MVAVPEGIAGPVFAVGLVLFGLVVGSHFAVRAHRQRQRAKARSERELTPLGRVYPSDDVAFVSGEVRPAPEGTIEATIAGDEAVVVWTQVRSRRPTSTDEQPNWRTDHESLDAVPFVVEDDTGSARVELPDEAEVHVQPETSEKVSHDSLMVTDGEMSDDVPEGVREYVDTHDTAPTYTRWYRQGAVRPGDRVWLMAEPVEGPTGFDGPDVTLTGDERPYIVLMADNEADTERPGTSWVFLAVFAAWLLLVGVLTIGVVLFSVLS